MFADVDHFPDRGPVRERTSGVPLKWFVHVLVCPDCALLVAWALVRSGLLGRGLVCLFIGLEPGILVTMGQSPIVYNTVQAQ